MARLARLWITASDVIRDRPAEFCGALPVRSVASVAGGGIERVVVAYVTGNAGRRHWGDVHPRQGKPRRAVIERGTRPVGRGVANGAVLREPCRNMIRNAAPELCSALPVRYVAPVAGGGIERVVVAHMAGGAGRRHRGNVHSGQGEPRNAVIERRSVPAPRCMARGTVRRGKSRSGSTVHRIARLLPCGQMAT